MGETVTGPASTLNPSRTSAPRHGGYRAVRYGPCGPEVAVGAISRTLRCLGGEALQTTLYGAPRGPFSEMPARNRLPGGLDAGFGTDGPTSVSGRDRGHSVPPRSSRPFSLVSVVTLSLFSI